MDSVVDVLDLPAMGDTAVPQRELRILCGAHAGARAPLQEVDAVVVRVARGGRPREQMTELALDLRAEPAFERRRVDLPPLHEDLALQAGGSCADIGEFDHGGCGWSRRLSR